MWSELWKEKKKDYAENKGEDVTPREKSGR